jgi:hypothetical protein
MIMGKIYTYQEVNNFVASHGCKLISKEYVNTRGKLKIMCVCGDTYVTSFTSFKYSKKRTCRECSNERLRKDRVKSHSNFVDEVENISPNCYKFLGKYKNSFTKIKVVHLECDNVIDVLPHTLLKGMRGCKHCAKNTKMNTSECKRVLCELIGSEFTLISEYLGSAKKIILRHNCESCNNFKFPTTPHSFSVFPTCPKCRNNIRHRDEEMFSEELKNITFGEFKLTGQYINTTIKVNVTHEICNYEFLITPSHVLSKGLNCPKCTLKHVSLGAHYIAKILDKENVKYEVEKRFDECKDVLALPFDFYIEDSILIEYDGEQHFHPIEHFGGVNNYIEISRRDEIKNLFCIKNKFNLFRIPFTERKNLQAIIRNILRCHTNNQDYSKEKCVSSFYVNEDWDHTLYKNKVI